MLIYADGSALARQAGADPESHAWSRFVDEVGDQLITSPLGLAEARRSAAPLGFAARDALRDLTDRITVVRLSDQALKAAARVSVAAPPDASIHMGIVLSNREVETMATYDLLVARLAAIHDLKVVSPGWAHGWWEG